MTNIPENVERYNYDVEIERLQSDKTAISQTASDYLHELEQLKAELVTERERWAKLVDALAEELGLESLRAEVKAREVASIIRKGGE
jgi:predicted  nucleic acid-binding Zn-ribbon protein